MTFISWSNCRRYLYVSIYKSNIRDGILNFDMEDFFTPSNNDDFNGAILMITSNQVVLALNSNNGEGPHAKAFAEAISEIYDLPIKDETFGSLSNIADHKINARLVNEEDAGTFISFLLTNLNSITSNEFKTFERFYREYNDIIRKISERFGFPVIHCIVPNFDENIKNRFTGQMSKTIIKKTATKIFIVSCSSGTPRKDKNGNIYPEFEVGTSNDGFQRNTVVMLYEAKYIDKNRVISRLGKTSNQFLDRIYNKLFEQIFEPIIEYLRRYADAIGFDL